MHRIVFVFSILSWSAFAPADVLYNQPHDGSGTLYQASWFAPDDSDWDQHVWDNFTLSSAQAITEIRWRGGYMYGGQFSPTIAEFTVAIWATSIANEPDIVNPPLVEYITPGNAGQTLAGTFGGAAMYDYHFTLPSPFQAAAGVKYWVYILAGQSGIPEWGLARGTGAEGAHFRWLRGAHQYQWISGDTAFTLIGSTASTNMINLGVSPAGAGTVQGAGAYPSGSNATLVADANVGWGFWRWTENGVPVSNNASYTFVVTADRTLIANFVPAYTVTTSSSPGYGGATSGGGSFNTGSSVTVTATPNHGFQFASWTEFGATVSTSAAYTFTVSANRALVANFQNAPRAVTFTFDNAPQFTSLPIDLTVSGLAAHFSATGGGYSIQAVGTVGICPPGFSGLCIWPNSVFPADLIVDFSETLTEFSILYSPQELGCDDSATMRATAFLSGNFVATATTTAPNPGTYPSHTLLITAPEGFNRVVVHYDVAPPTCQDWGPIFLADNATAVRQLAPCPADCTLDRLVNVNDLLMVINNWGPKGGQADITGDGTVNVNDLLMVINNWGACP